MNKWSAYWRLMRFNKPVGTLLLWWPTAWALWLANQGAPTFYVLVLFLLGTIFMRAAGCVINDIADRHIDLHVSRTKLRPLTSGKISLQEAFLILFILLSASLGILLQLPQPCFYWALISLIITFVYPFCKRFIQAPQMVLGFAFSMGIPMAYTAASANFGWQFILLLLINFAWILAYDTMYAITDREDDLKIGVKSTAIYFGQYDSLIIGLLLVTMHALWLLQGLYLGASPFFYLCWFIAAGILIYQMILIRERLPEQCFKAFLISVYYGFMMWLAIVLS